MEGWTDGGIESSNVNAVSIFSVMARTLSHHG